MSDSNFMNSTCNFFTNPAMW